MPLFHCIAVQYSRANIAGEKRAEVHPGFGSGCQICPALVEFRVQRILLGLNFAQALGYQSAALPIALLDGIRVARSPLIELRQLRHSLVNRRPGEPKGVGFLKLSVFQCCQE